MGLRFVIQKHAASTPHYDFRLEMDGVLKSWAIPREPSEDSSPRRLAVHTGDLPLESAQVEGASTDELGEGPVELWDRGTWIPQGSPLTAYRRGQLEFVLKGRRMKGSWSLKRMGNASSRKKDLWLLVKRDDTA